MPGLYAQFFTEVYFHEFRCIISYMTKREKIAHLLRRFGLGARQSDLDALEKLGVDGAIEYLIEYENQDEGFPVSPWEFCFEEANPEQVYLDPFRPAGWWGLRLVLTKRPLQEKLTFFWHDHFAVSGAKVEFGPMMLAYMQTLRKNANGNFKKLLVDITKDPAMLRFLDGDANIKGEPNENFARELLELFTLGEGNYTEKDIKEVARAFTGYGWRLLIDFGKPIEEQAKRMMEKDIPMTPFAFSPDLHDDGEKMILAQRGRFGGDEVVNILCERPETAKNITGKLFKFFVGKEAAAKTQEQMMKVYFDGKYEIKPILKYIAKCDEFWDEKQIRKMVKSPLDFVVPIFRQLDVGDFLLAMRKQDAKPTTAIPQILGFIGSGVVFIMSNQGLFLLYPPDVGGWEWGEAWISSDTMTQRMSLGPSIFGSKEKQEPSAGIIAQYIIRKGANKSDEAMVDAFLEFFDARVHESARQGILRSAKRFGGVNVLTNEAKNSEMMGELTRLLFAVPEFNLC